MSSNKNQEYQGGQASEQVNVYKVILLNYHGS
jgi:hypothetical protein